MVKERKHLKTMINMLEILKKINTMVLANPWTYLPRTYPCHPCGLRPSQQRWDTFAPTLLGTVKDGVGKYFHGFDNTLRLAILII